MGENFWELNGLLGSGFAIQELVRISTRNKRFHSGRHWGAFLRAEQKIKTDHRCKTYIYRFKKKYIDFLKIPFCIYLEMHEMFDAQWNVLTCRNVFLK